MQLDIKSRFRLIVIRFRVRVRCSRLLGLTVHLRLVELALFFGRVELLDLLGLGFFFGCECDHGWDVFHNSLEIVEVGLLQLLDEEFVILFIETCRKSA